MMNPAMRESLRKARAMHAAALVAEAAVVCCLIAWLLATGHPLRAVAIAGLPLLIRAGYAAALTIVARILHPTPEATTPLTPAWLKLVARGAGAILRNQIGMAFPPDLPILPSGSSGQGPIIALVHGYSCNAGCFGSLPKRLSRRGIDCVVIELGDPTGDLDASAAEVAAWLADVRRRAPDRSIALTGISMGGLVARLALARDNAPKVDNLVTISSPHAGTWTAHFGFGEAARQMRPGSDVIRRLADLPPPCPATALWTPDDTIILPPTSGKLAGAKIVAIPGYTHLAVVEAPAVEEVIVRTAGAVRTLQTPRIS
jgi:triacylglycerol esterase/lipase EstA (alpha/beta hydrolase family)